MVNTVRSVTLKDRAYQEKLAARLECLGLEEKLFGDNAKKFDNRKDLLRFAANFALSLDKAGPWAEFGVNRGGSIRLLADYAPSDMIGFDSFEGLPTDWNRGRYNKVDKDDHVFTKVLPNVPENVTLQPGWFDETLKKFQSQYNKNFVLIHIDVDVYESAIYVLKNVAMANQCVVVFDDYFNYPGWRTGEWKAFEEFKRAKKCKVRCIGFCPNFEQAAFLVQS